AAAAPRRGNAIGLGLALALFTAFMYAMVGNPAALLPQTAPDSPAQAPDQAQVNAGQGPAGNGAGGMTPAQIEGMVARLAQRLQQQPDDVAGWRMLVRSYETLGRYPQAVDAWRRLLALKPDDPDLLTDYAVTLGMSQGQSLAGEPEAALN
ncbi:tetratricopeptide repeat protein, partial [Klebsiella pneumoniae]|uniref:tetratricopeptide repeat protein n=1 Tax=Klebsiella pneumoniae TaxID=573 RepID=UPI002230C657